MDKLKLARRKKGLTQQQVAKLLGCLQPAVSKWERRMQAPSGANAKAYAKLLGLRLEEVL